jgi:hypothetical protein
MLYHVDSRVNRTPLEHVSFGISDDCDLIRAYLEGHTEIEPFECPSCKHICASRKNYLAQDHSDAAVKRLSQYLKDRMAFRARAIQTIIDSERLM